MLARSASPQNAGTSIVSGFQASDEAGSPCDLPIDARLDLCFFPPTLGDTCETCAMCLQAWNVPEASLSLMKVHAASVTPSS